jgi:hypothetical protein
LESVEVREEGLLVATSSGVEARDLVSIDPAITGTPYLLLEPSSERCLPRMERFIDIEEDRFEHRQGRLLREVSPGYHGRHWWER